MSLGSIGQIVTDITHEPAWEAYRAWQEILDVWPEVLERLVIGNQSVADLAQQIYPRTRRGDLLQVATANASLANHCNWQRRSLLVILNGKLTQPLQDLRFSSSRWQAAALPTETLEQIDYNHDRQRCPQCDCCTPQWELERWSVCRFCAIPRWQGSAK
jgi:predicted nucleic acid-binding Zn ribbon protein